MTQYYRRSRGLGPSRRSDPPATVYSTLARRRREALLKLVFTCAGVLVVGSLAGLAWYFAGHTEGLGAAGDTLAEAADSGDPSAQGASVLPGYELEPLLDLVAFRDAAYVPVKAVHEYSNRLADKAFTQRVIDKIDNNEFNALVIPVKDDNGQVAYDSQAPMALEYGTVNPIIWGGDLDALLAILAEHKIIPIARVVCFKDNGLTKTRPDLAIQDKDTGQPWTDYKGNRYLNPYKHEAWEYMVQVAEDAAKRGFVEIQFDYIRFPASMDGDLSTVSYPDKYCTKEEAIAGFLAYARPRLEPLGVWVSADVFGYVVDKTGDQGIGQNLELMSPYLDIVCPMVYPDLYELGAYGIPYPAGEPYKLVSKALAKTTARLAGIGTKCRPWLQAHDDYLSQKIPYTAALIQQEIDAAADLGFDEYLLWGGYPDLGL